jgi:protoporphyrinogen oxidase
VPTGERDAPHAVGTVVVIGAGPAGLAAAARLVELGHAPVVVEASGRWGGMAGSTTLWDHIVDFGPHRFFSADPVVTSFWHRYVAGDFVMVARQTRILYRGRYFDYPLKAANAVRNLGVVAASRAVASYVSVRVRPEPDDGSLESWVANRFGRVLFTTFFQTYTEKLWGVSCRSLDADWAAQRIQGLTLGAAVLGAIRGNRGNRHKTLVDEFAYPVTGSGLLYDRLRAAIVDGGGRVRLDAPVQRVLVTDGRATGVVLADGEVIEADWVVSSMPITLLLRGLPEVPDEVAEAAGRLRFRNTILVYLLADADDLFPDQWLYVHDPALRHGRITNFRNWSPAIAGDDGRTVLCLEFWCFDDDPLWGADEADLVRLATEEVTATGLLDGASILDGAVVRVPRCYPVYEHGYQEPLQVVTDHLDTIDRLVPIGRYGAFKYNNQDHSLLMGILAAEAIVEGRAPDLWGVNTDSTYQESGTPDVLARGATG